MKKDNGKTFQCCCEECLCGAHVDEKGVHEGHHEHMVQDFKRRFWISLILTIPILILSPMIQAFLGLKTLLSFPGDIYFLFAISSGVFFYGGWPFLRGLYDELKSKSPGMMTLIAIAIIVAYLYSSAIAFGLTGKLFFWELVTLIDIMLLGHWIEMKSIMGAGRALEELAKLMPSTAHKIMADKSIQDVPVSDLKTEDLVLIKPGEKIPADGQVIEGESSVNESMLTGESNPVAKSKGGEAIGGSINGEGSLTLQVKKMGKDSYLSQVINLVKEAQESKSKTQDLANRAALWLTIIALLAGTVTFLVWMLFTTQTLAFAMERTVTVMVITCPHALGLAVPLVVAVSTAIGAKKGLLIRNRAAFEDARKTSAIVFDKTGTLTEGKFGVTDVIPYEGDEKSLLSLAASVEAHSEHPLAKAIASSAEKTEEVQGFKAIPGKGAEGKVLDKDVKTVSPGYLRENNISMEDERIANFHSQGKTVIFVLINGKLSGAIALADIIRPESKEAIQKLKEMKIRCLMLTGDNDQVAKWVSEQLGLDEYIAQVLPHQKKDKIAEVQSRGFFVAMTGDGVNDAPALAQADVGIAVGAGTDVAIETADVILVRSNPLDVVHIAELARATYKKMIQNLIWATGYNVFAIPIAAGVLYKMGIVLSPAVAAIFMSLSTVICAVNAQLLRISK
ncbi:MAG: copper-translocating P-type ATPase [Simkaniaceae bacterium]|nr:copper-translocating P-type ATPase [Candidatus Sacchlamyda saccharinae]